jgi:hypothetical protein
MITLGRNPFRPDKDGLAAYQNVLDFEACSVFVKVSRNKCLNMPCGKKSGFRIPEVHELCFNCLSRLYLLPKEA